MTNIHKLVLAATLISLGGCATVMKGTTQKISVNTNPQGAACDVSREGAKLSSLPQTPATVEVSRDKNALSFSCTKAPEHAEATAYTVESKFNGATLGNILLGGVVGVVVDASTGSNYSYPENVTIDLVAGAPLAATTTDPTSAAAPVAGATPAPASTATTSAAAEPASAPADKAKKPN